MLDSFKMQKFKQDLRDIAEGKDLQFMFKFICHLKT